MITGDGNPEETRLALANAGPIANAALYNNGKALWDGIVQSGALTQANATVTPQPVGALMPFAGSSAPAGWLLCAGQPVSRTGYADLFAVVGTTYGVGDGSTTFNVPDLRGRVLAGKDDMGGTAASRLTSGVSGITGTTLGAAGGDQRLQGHTHTFSGTTGNDSPDHSHSIGKAFDLSAYGWSIFGGGAGWTLNGSTGTSGASARHQHGFSGTTANHNQPQGSSANVQPTIVTNYIIKAIADPVNTIGVALSGTAGGDLTGSYPSPTIANVSANALPAGSVVQVQRYEWSNVTTMSGATWTTCNGSSYTFTPLYAGSRLFVFSDIAVHAYWPGGTYAGMSTRLLWRGSVITTQSAVAGHEHYMHTGGGNPDLYQRSAKNASVIAGAGAGVLSTQIQAYASTSVVEVNQVNQWASGYTIIEVKQ